MGGGSSVQPWRAGAVFTVSSSRTVTALEGWITAAGNGTYWPCCLSTGGGFRYMLMERIGPWEPWTTIAWTAWQGELQCTPLLLPNGLTTCCEPAVPSPISLPVETCAEMLPGRDYVFVYEAAVRPFDYWFIVPATAANGGRPYHVIAGGAGCAPPSCLDTASAAAATPGPGPSLPTPSTSGSCISLFVDPNRDLQDLAAETAAYVPEGRSSTGFPTHIHLVATMPASENFPAVDMTFSCQSSAWRGDAGNGPGSTDPDFQIIGPTVVPFAPLAGTDLVVAVTEVIVTDWAGEATFTAVPSRGGAEHAAALFVPVGAETDHLPDGWKAEHDDFVTATVSAAGLASCDDVDGQPGGTGVVGDGLATWEEYRGFFVNGRHVRTDPAVKDLFVNRVGRFRPLGQADPTLATLATLPTADHLVVNADVESDDGTLAVNPNNIGSAIVPCPSLSERRPVRLYIEWGVTGPGPMGETAFTSGHGCPPGPWAPLAETVTPGIVASISVHVRRIRQITPPNASPDAIDAVDAAVIEYVAAHELGHAINITHYTPFPNLCPYYCPAPNDRGFPFPTSDHFCQQLRADALPSNDPFRWPETNHARRGSPGDSCGNAVCMAPSQQRPECAGQSQPRPVFPMTPTGSCGPESVMASQPNWWARPTCSAVPSTLPSPWGDQCDPAVAYWTNIPATYSASDISQVQVKP